MQGAVVKQVAVKQVVRQEGSAVIEYHSEELEDPAKTLHLNFTQKSSIRGYPRDFLVLSPLHLWKCWQVMLNNLNPVGLLEVILSKRQAERGFATWRLGGWYYLGSTNRII